MLDKIVLSSDKHHARVYFDTHSIGVHSDGNVMELIEEIILEPSRRLEERYRIAEEITQEINLHVLFPPLKVGAA
jgi:hypothetical protein